MSKETVNKFSIIDLPQIPPSVDNALQNLTDKPTKSAGETFSDIWYLVFGSLSHIADKRRIKYAMELEQFKAEVESSISHIPSENRIEPSIQVTAQALENSKYCIEEPELRNMFVALISNSMNSDYVNHALPAFAEMIKQMSPLDGQILKVLKESPSNTLPLCNYKRKLGPKSGYQIIAEKVFIEPSFNDIDKNSLAISSLERLGLVTIPPFQFLANKAVYKKFELHPLYLESQKAYGDALALDTCLISLTPLGKSFVEVCIPD